MHMYFWLSSYVCHVSYYLSKFEGINTIFPLFSSSSFFFLFFFFLWDGCPAVFIYRANLLSRWYLFKLLIVKALRPYCRLWTPPYAPRTRRPLRRRRRRHRLRIASLCLASAKTPTAVCQYAPLAGRVARSFPDEQKNRFSRYLTKLDSMEILSQSLARTSTRSGVK
jgi:hypothetical protein